MKLNDLNLHDLLDTNVDAGTVTFAGTRALILDAVAMGLLRRELFETLGPTATRTVLTRFGFAHGWRSAQGLQHGVNWEHPQDWQRAGGVLHTIQGQVRVVIPPWDPQQGPEPFAHSHWRDSYEAEQHLLHSGSSAPPRCSTLCGFASGYLSYVNGRDIFCFETACVACGEPHCRVEGRAFEDWDEVHQRQIKTHFRAENLDEELTEATQRLRVLEQQLASARREHAQVSAGGPPLEAPAGMIVRSKAMWSTLTLARRVAPTDTTVILRGESGVGKERLASYIHQHSARAAGPFIAVNCGAIDDNLLESELFGHARGAFTGANQARAGLFESAGGGTLFLDEIGEVSAAMQVKLLRVLETRKIRRVGESKTRPVDVRILAATHRDLEADVVTGRFREDLFYRLRVFEIFIAPLRERRDDILELARAFIDARARTLGRHFEGLGVEAADALLSYDWPGNVRELANAIEYATIVTDGPRIQREHLPRQLTGPSTLSTAAGAPVPGRPLREVERDHILATLEANSGNRETTARQLGIGIATLYRRLRSYASEGVTIH